MARRSQIAGRLLAVLDSNRRRDVARASGVLMAALVGLAVMVPVASLTLVKAVRAAAQQAGVERAGSADVRVAIPAMEARYREALKRRDAKELALYYTRDSMVIPAHGIPARGRAAAGDVLQYLLDNGVADITIEQMELHPVGDLFLEVGRATLWHDSGAAAANLRFMTLWKQEDGEWRIHRDIAMPFGKE